MGGVCFKGEAEDDGTGPAKAKGMAEKNADNPASPQETYSQAPVKVYVGKASSFDDRSVRGARIVHGGGREMAVWKVDGDYFALDNACYHHGASLANGDIEELGGKTCVVCPWHGYRITLKEGEGLYWGLKSDFAGTLLNKRDKVLRSKGCKQRPHRVVRGLDADELYIEINDDAEPIESDVYASRAMLSGGNSGIHSGMNDLDARDAPDSPRRLSKSVKGRPVKLLERLPIAESNETCLFRFGVLDAEPASVADVDLRTGIPGQFAEIYIPQLKASRMWTVVSRPSDTMLELIVRKVDDGLVSSHLIDAVKVGQDLRLLSFGGDFGFTVHPLPHENASVLLICAGVGITPIIAMMRAALTEDRMRREGRKIGDITLFYSDRSLAAFIARDEVEAWAQSPGVRLVLHLTRAAPETVAAWTGVDPDQPAIERNIGRILPSQVVEACPTPRHTYICGPGPFMSGMHDALVRASYPEDLIHMESFTIDRDP